MFFNKVLVNKYVCNTRVNEYIYSQRFKSIHGFQSYWKIQQDTTSIKSIAGKV